LKRVATTLILAFVLLCSGGHAKPRFEATDIVASELSAVDSPAVCVAVHNVGNMVIPVENNGCFGRVTAHPRIPTCFGDEIISMQFGCQFPKGDIANYLARGAVWVGAIVEGDTLVSVGADGWRGGGEMFPDAAPKGNIIFRSTVDPAKPWYEGAISEEDFIATYYDTCERCPGMIPDPFDGRSHRRLDIEVTQRSYAWSYPYAKNFILFDYTIRNIGFHHLKNVYIGVHVDSDVGSPSDDVGGFRRVLPSWYSPSRRCAFQDSVNIAWVADADADMGFTPNVTGTRIVRTPTEDNQISYNWWVGGWDLPIDFGPQRRSRYRDFSTGGQGFPVGDRNKYWVLRNGEVDYDQIYTALKGLTDSVWTAPPPGEAADIAMGQDVYYLLSVGPFNLEPGQSLPLTFAYVGGLNFHHVPGNEANLPDNPDEYYRNLDFSNFAYNATWADWVYDNPGFDTDGDGYFGKFHICDSGDSTLDRIDTVFSPDSTWIMSIDTIWSYATQDTIWYQGDGVPDFRAASPPPRPDIRLITSTGKIVIRFNGWQSETARDFFTHKVDFEGYRIYMARDDRWDSYTLLDSYDREDYNKFRWDTATKAFELKEDPYTLLQLRCAYAPEGCGDLTWNPLIYTREHPYTIPGYDDSVFYFTEQDFNRSNPGVNTRIRKLYPDATKPRTFNKDSCLASDTTDDGYFKYYDYEFTIDNLLPTVPYYFNVCTFDFGSRSLGMPPMESPRTLTPILVYAQNSSDSVEAKGLKVGIYPNPYRIDAHYAADGYEGRGKGERDRPADRNRRIHFYNLPAKCTIKIFTLDGDLVREIDHDFDSSDPMSNHDTWDLISRNTQLVVSGLYYWTVEDRNGKVQIGKLVIIM
jgi:hypothetical protein